MLTEKIRREQRTILLPIIVSLFVVMLTVTAEPVGTRPGPVQVDAAGRLLPIVPEPPSDPRHTAPGNLCYGPGRQRIQD